MSAPRRFKPRDEWGVEEILHHKRTGEEPESEEYRAARNKALEDAGLEADRDAEPKPLEEMEPADHFQQIRRHQ